MHQERKARVQENLNYWQMEVNDSSRSSERAFFRNQASDGESATTTKTFSSWPAVIWQ